MPDIILAATDGSALPTNPGPAAWAYVIADEDFAPGEPVSGTLGWSTNNVAELTAIREVLKATEGPIVIRADSQYAIAAAMGLHKATKNHELIAEIRALVEPRNVAFEHVRAHQADGDPLNAVADEAANAAATAQGGPLQPPSSTVRETAGRATWSGGPEAQG
ncbi:RNase H family protein [Streptomyces sp. NBC_00470]|uniref:ribonuclease HI n=1 Tax=Streptomyces sp. NBC_00470 TaxID=2975753 RepID=UPI002F9135FC